jgi:hypothetical protein
LIPTKVTDDVIKMLVEIIQRLDRRSDQQLYRELLRDLQRVEGKIQILFRVAEVVTTKPEGTIREVLFPIVKEETFRQLVVESRNTGPQFRLFRQALMRGSLSDIIGVCCRWCWRYFISEVTTGFNPSSKL